jgi:hypothetical protein
MGVRGRGGDLQREVKGLDVLVGLSLMGRNLGHNRKAILLPWSLIQELYSFYDGRCKVDIRPDAPWRSAEHVIFT